MPTECRRTRPPENRLYRRGQSPSGEAALPPPQGDFLGGKRAAPKYRAAPMSRLDRIWYKSGFDGGAPRRRARASQTAGREAQGNPQLSEQSHFLRMQKIPKQKEKATTGKFICQAVACFLRGLRNDSWKKGKKMASPMGFEPMLPG